MRQPKPTSIDANSHAGRTLLALRAGPMTTVELADRFPEGNKVHELTRKGFVEKVDERFQLTTAGRAACPLRNPLAASVESAPVGARHSRMAIPAAIQPSRQSDFTSNEGDIMGRGLTISGTKTPIFKARDAITLAIAGIDKDHAISREDLIERVKTDVDRKILGNVIKNMGIDALVIGAYGHTTARRYFDIRTLKSDSLANEGERQSSSTAAPTSAPAPAAVSDHDHPADALSRETDAPEVEFSIYNDGRLAIIDGDEVFVIPPDATRRLGYFLGCLEMNTWPPRLDPHAALVATPAQ